MRLLHERQIMHSIISRGRSNTRKGHVRQGRGRLNGSHQRVRERVEKASRLPLDGHGLRHDQDASLTRHKKRLPRFVEDDAC
jgi:hypothetical protein